MLVRLKSKRKNVNSHVHSNPPTEAKMSCDNLVDSSHVICCSLLNKQPKHMVVHQARPFSHCQGSCGKVSVQFASPTIS